MTKRPISKAFIIISLFAILLLGFSISGFSTIYYVNTAADAGGDGTTQELTGEHCAFKTIAQVNAASPAAGDSILFKKGETWREQLTVPSSGTNGHPITFGAYGDGADPIINGSDIMTTWVAGGREAGIFVGDMEEEVDAFTTQFDGKTVDAGVTLTVQSGTALNGTYSAMIDFDGTNDQAYAYKTFAEQTSCYVRFYFKLSADFTAGEAYQTGELFSLRDGTNQLIQIILAATPNTTTFAISNVRYLGETNVGSAASLTRGTTYYIDLYWKNHPTEGGLQWWLDGVSKGSTFIYDTSSFKPDNLWIGVATSTIIPTETSELYFDDVKISASSIGAFSADANVWAKVGVTTQPWSVCMDGTMGNIQGDFWNLLAEYNWHHNTVDDITYIYAATDPDARYTDPGVEVSQRNWGINVLGKSYIDVSNIAFEKFIQHGVRIKRESATACSYINVSNCTSRHNGMIGFNIAGSGGNYPPDNIILDTCTSYLNQMNGIMIDSYGTNITIDDCAIYNNAWTTIPNPTSWPIAGIRAITAGDRSYIDEVLVQGCHIYSNGPVILERGVANDQKGYGLHFDTITDGIARNNLIYDNDRAGIEVENSISCEAYYNIIYNHPTSSGFELYRENESNEIYNNVSYNNSIGILVGTGNTTELGVVNNLIKNNICTNNSWRELKATAGGENDGTKGIGNVYEHNCFDSESSGFIEWGSGIAKNTYDDWELAYQESTYSVELDPLFVGAGNYDFHLQGSSPCINAGTDVDLTEDYEGLKIRHAPDIGAHENQTNALFFAWNLFKQWWY